MPGSRKPKVLIVFYTMYGHIYKLAQEVAKGVEEAGAEVTLRQIKETLSEDVLKAMYAPPKPDVPIVSVDELADYDALIFGCGTRFGQPAAQYKAFWDQTGQLWFKGTLNGKFASFFTASASNGGTESTAITQLSHFVHHGMLFVPLGYGNPALSNLDVVHAGSPWAAGTYTGSDGSRQPNEIELGLARYQGKRVAEFAARFVRGGESA